MYTCYNKRCPDSNPNPPSPAETQPQRTTFECHITLRAFPWDRNQAEVVAKLRGWKTSEISRDPVLGDATYFYLTLHRGRQLELEEEMIACCRDLQKLDIPILRCKIEQIVFDTKTGIGTLSYADPTGAVPTKPAGDGGGPPMAVHPISGAHSLS